MFRILVAALLSALVTLPAVAETRINRAPYYAQPQQRSAPQAQDLITGLATLALTYYAFRQLGDHDDRRAIERPRRHYTGRGLPAECLVRIKGRHGSTSLYGARCLQSRVGTAAVRALPAACRLEVRSNRQRRLAFDRGCLDRYGWIARR